jgi:hypothetical protein
VTAYAGVAAPAPQWVEVITDRIQLDSVAAELEDLGRRCGMPVSARPAWTRAALDAVPAADPLAVLIRDETGHLRAAAVLLVMPGPGADTVVLPSGLDHRGGLPAEDVWAAAALGESVADVLARRPRTTVLRIGPLAVNSAAVTSLYSALPGAALVTTKPIPVVRRVESTDVHDYLSHGLRRGLRRGHNRLVADGRRATVHFTTDAPEIARLAPEMEAACRDRDHAHGRTSPLDDSTGRALWHRRLQHLLAAGVVELASLRIDDELAAYVLGLTDVPAYRVLEGRFVDRFARYSPGRLLEAAVLTRVLDDPAYELLDWMTAIAPETLLAANDTDAVVMVQAELPGGVANRGTAAARGLARRSGTLAHR